MGCCGGCGGQDVEKETQEAEDKKKPQQDKGDE
jgi:hypothetical protein